MIELPETYVLSEQSNRTLTGKTIQNVWANTNPHKFAFYSGDPSAYNSMLSGMKITETGTGISCACGTSVEIVCEDMVLSINNPVKYHAPGEKLPKTHQLLVQFTDDSYISSTVQMWGSMLCIPLSKRVTGDDTPGPLTDEFDENYFEDLINSVKPTLSVKALLATEQRIPGLGNGVLQDILYNAEMHPKRKVMTFNDVDKEKLFRSVKDTLKEMKELGGRDTERDLFNNKGGYHTILSKNTLNCPCRKCGNGVVRQAFLGGNIYFCPHCQPVNEI